MSAKRATTILTGVALSLTSGCALFDKEVIRQLQMYQARQIARSRLCVFTLICLMAIPPCVLAGFLWARRRVSLKACLVVMAIDGLLLALFTAARAYFY